MPPSNGAKKRRAKGFIKDRKNETQTTEETINIQLKIGYWNANGLTGGEKKESIADMMVKQEIDVMCISETHLRSGNHEDLTALGEFKMVVRERGYGDKNGGGLMVLIRRGVTHLVWEPPDEQFPEVNKEKSWILLQEGQRKVGICFVYLAAQCTGKEDFKEWNRKIYSSLQGDMRILAARGFEHIVMGDFNGHVGQGADGIPGNLAGVNSNGVLLQDFIAVNDLRLINADRSRTKGLFTRTAGGYSTILDYVVSTRRIDKDITSLTIDEAGDLITGSDHAALVLQMSWTESGNKINEDYNEHKIRIPRNTDYKAFQLKLDDLLGEIDWGSLDLEQQCQTLQESLVEAGKLTFGYGAYERVRKPRKKVSRSLRMLKLRRKVQERLMKKAAALKSRRIAAGRVWNIGEEEVLQEKLERHRITADKLARKLFDLKMRRRSRLREITKMGSRAFWRLVRKVEKQWSNITAIEDENGELFTDRLIVEEIVLREISKIFKGQRSRIFEFKGEQLVAASYKINHTDQEDWITKEADATEHESEVCSPVLKSKIIELIGKLKDTRASGIDNIPTMLFKNASELYYDRLTEMINRCLTSGQTPQILNVGKMTLIDKKEASMQISKKRPLTVSSQLQSIITKVLNERMNKICERMGYFGTTQYGFRSSRSTSDCIFLLLRAITKARKKKYKISVAFCDLTKAYDSVNREILYKKLVSIGFGGKVLSMIQSMNFNDCIKVKIGGEFSEPVWFTRGVKQGCCLSQLLFSLYIAGLGIKLQETKLGVQLGTETITGLFFADDLVLISKTSSRGMMKLLKMVDKFCKDMCMMLSVEKTYMLTMGPKERSCKIGSSDNSLEETLVAKYLGVNIRLRGRNTIQREKDVVATARRHANAIMGLTRAGLDRAKVAKRLWEVCAIPAILYGSETMVFSDKVIKELETTQAAIGAFILQIPQSSSKVAGWIEAGLRPMQYRLKSRKALYYWSLSKNTKDVIIQECLKELIDGEGQDDPWVVDIRKIEAELQESIPTLTKPGLKKKLDNIAIDFVLSVKRDHQSVCSMPQPEKWFKIQPHITDGDISRYLNLTRAGNLGLGNRMKNINGDQFKMCPWCEKRGVNVRLKEPHVLLICPGIRDIRTSLEIINQCPEQFRKGLMLPHIALKYFLGEDGSSPVVLRKRAIAIRQMVSVWLNRTG